MGRKYGRLCIGVRGAGGGCFRLKRSRRSASFSSSPTMRHSAEFLSNSDSTTNNIGVNIGETAISDQKLVNNIDDNNEKSIGNKIMVVVDSSLEAKGALDWALSHTVQSQDTVVLLHVAKPTSKKDLNRKVNDLKATEVLHSMKNMCERKRPGVRVETKLVHGKEKGGMIIEEAKKQKVALLVLGQKRKRSLWWGLMMMWTLKAKRRDVADYCIQYAQCMTIAVRSKNKKLGGYLITTKRHKNFWLLA